MIVFRVYVEPIFNGTVFYMKRAAFNTLKFAKFEEISGPLLFSFTTA